MDKIRSILILTLRRTVTGISFRRVIHVSLMLAMLILAGCSSSSTPSATVTATYEMTATFTATVKPTSTAVEITPTLVEGAIITDKGLVFVEDGKLMMSVDGKIVPITFDKFTFNTEEDASKVVLELHASEFADQEKLHEDLTPGSVLQDYSYNMAVNKIAFSGSLDEGAYVSVAGIPTEYVRVKSPSESEKFPELGIVMLRVFGDEKPVPLTLGIFDVSGNFLPFYSDLSMRPPDSYPLTTEKKSISSGTSWTVFQSMIGNSIIVSDLLYAMDPKTSANFSEPDGKNKPADHLPSVVVAERNELIELNLQQAELGFAYTMENDSKHTGDLLESLDTTFYLSNQSFLAIIPRK